MIRSTCNFVYLLRKPSEQSLQEKVCWDVHNWCEGLCDFSEDDRKKECGKRLWSFKGISVMTSRSTKPLITQIPNNAFVLEHTFVIF